MAPCGGFEAAAAHPALRGVRIETVNLGTSYVPHGDLPSLYRLTGLTAEQLAQRAEELLRQGRENA